MKTYEEIIKSLESCTNQSVGCDDCVYDTMDSGCTQLKKDALKMLKELKAQLEQPVQINEAAMQSHSEEICKLNDELCKVSMELERYQRECAEAQRELTHLRAVKATAEAFLGRKINGQM